MPSSKGYYPGRSKLRQLAGQSSNKKEYDSRARSVKNYDTNQKISKNVRDKEYKFCKSNYDFNISSWTSTS
jgi:hypothetical protein